MKKPRQRGNRLGFRIFDLFISMGIGHAYALLRFVAFYYLVFDVKAGRAMRWYVDTMWNSPPLPKRLLLIYKLFVGAGEKLLDIRILATGSGNVELQCDTDEMRNLIAEGRGLIFFTAHAGNWQLMMRKLPDFGVDVAILKRPETNQAVDEFLEIDLPSSQRERIRIIDASDGLNAVVSVMRELASGNIVSIMGDAPAPGSKTIPVKFLGEATELPEGPFRLAASCEVPIMALFAQKKAKCKYVLRSKLIYSARKNDLPTSSHEKTKELACEYAAALEAFLKKNPFEWTPGGRL